MRPTERVQSYLNRQVGRRTAATTIVVAAAVLPLWFLRSTADGDFAFSPMSVFVAGLYVTAITGLVLLAIGKRGIAVTSDAADETLRRLVATIMDRLMPVAVIVAVAWMGYRVWHHFAGQ